MAVRRAASGAWKMENSVPQTVSSLRQSVLGTSASVSSLRCLSGVEPEGPRSRKSYGGLMQLLGSGVLSKKQFTCEKAKVLSA